MGMDARINNLRLQMPEEIEKKRKCFQLAPCQMIKTTFGTVKDIWSKSDVKMNKITKNKREKLDQI